MSKSRTAPHRLALPHIRLPVTLAGVAIVATVVARSAWLSDDGFITLRTIDNFVNGYGLRWNVAERVQSYTHPAWLIVLTPFYALTREPYLTVSLLQVALTTMTAALLLYRVAIGTGQAVWGIAAFLSAKALVDYSTSGLENPLTHLVLLLTFLVWQSRHGQPALLGLCLSATLLCRDDLLLLVGPAIVARWVEWRPPLRRILLGLAPFLAWKVFSLVYYGALVPNTALAKLSTGIPSGDLVSQGLRYWRATFVMDPMTPVLLVAGAIALATLYGRKGHWMTAGLVLYSLYLVRVGGDFMSGRFFSPMLIWAFAGIIGLSPARLRLPTWSWVGASLVLLAGSLAATPEPALLTPGRAEASSEPYVEHWGVTDERRFYYSSTGLLPRLKGGTPNAWERAGKAAREAATERAVVQASNVGLFGFFAGPRVHILDRNALCDPLLARLPAKMPWRIGHFTRDIPDGYTETWKTGVNSLQPPGLQAFYDDLKTVVQGPIWTRARFSVILRLATGHLAPP